MGKKISLTHLYLWLLVLLGFVNLIGVFNPEVGFDALWYHLTLPKLWLLQKRWYYPGGLLYYSAMPRLGELLFTPLLVMLGTVGPKLLQFLAGILTAFFTYKISRRFFNHQNSLFSALIFYGTWLVSWQSGSAYVDLLRTFFEVVALFFILKNQKLLAGIFLGLAIGVKWHALGSLLIYAGVFSPWIIPPALFISLPWFLIAYHYTQNPLYPLFEKFMFITQISQVESVFFNPIAILKRILLSPLSLSFPIDDFLNPLLCFLYLAGVFYLLRHKNIHHFLIKILIMTILSLVVWQLTPPPSSRYLLPYLPAIALISTFAFKSKLHRILKIIFIASIIILIFIRLVINLRPIKVILGKITLNQYLNQISTKLPGTFIDSDDFVSNNIPSDARVLVDVWHNLYYLPVNFDHVTWADPNHKYQYLITKDQDVGKINANLIHTNSIGAQIFKLND